MYVTDRAQLLELSAGPHSSFRRHESTAMPRLPDPKRARSQPPRPAQNEQTPPWLKKQAERLDAAHQVFSGLTSTTTDEVYPALYTSTPGEAIDFAEKVVATHGWGNKPQSTQPGPSSSSSQPSKEWVRQAQRDGVEVRSHHEANLMQNRFGEDSPTMFNPARHTVVIAGRPVQATMDSHLVMSHQPCASHHSFEKLVSFLSCLPGALVARRTCALLDHVTNFSSWRALQHPTQGARSCFGFSIRA